MFLKHCKWALLWALVILILCGIPGRDIPHISFLEELSFDKFVHAGIFFVQFLLTARGFLLQTNFIKLKQSAKLISFIIGSVYGGLLEIMQATVIEGRCGDVYDFIADSLGAALGFAMYNWVEKIFLEKLIK